MSLVVFIPNITTNHAITYTNLGYLNPALNNSAQNFKTINSITTVPAAQFYCSTYCYNITDFQTVNENSDPFENIPSLCYHHVCPFNWIYSLYS